MAPPSPASTVETALPDTSKVEMGTTAPPPTSYKEMDNSKGDSPPVEDLEKSVASEFPDGGWRAWLVVAGGFATSFTVWGATNAFGVFQAYYQENQLSNRSHSAISWIGSFQLCMVMACSVISGKLFDTGYIKYLLWGGTVIYTAGLFGLSYAGAYYQIFLAQGVACGVAAGIIFLPAVSSVSHWFRLRRATALGILACGSSIGGVAYPLLLNKCFKRVGFAWTTRAFGFLTLGFLLIACFTVNTRLPPRKGGPLLDFSVFKQLEYTLFVAGDSLIIVGLYFPYFYTQTYSRLNGVDENVALYCLSILNAASLFGRIIPNWLADTWGAFAILIPNCLVSGFLIFGWIGMCRTTVGTIFFSILYGLSSGAYVSMMPVCIASITPPNEMNKIGIRIAMAFLVISVFALVGTPISGAIVTSQGGDVYTGAAIFSGIIVLVGTGFTIWAWVVIKAKKGTPWV